MKRITWISRILISCYKMIDAWRLILEIQVILLILVLNPWLILAAMIIAVYDNLKERNNKDPERKFIKDLISTCSLSHPGDQFYFISAITELPENSGNLKFIGIEEPRFPLLRKKRYVKKIAKVLDAIGADKIVFNDGYHSKDFSVPQILILHEKSGIKNYAKMDFDTIQSIMVLNESTKTKLIAHFRIDPDKIKNIHFGISDQIQPLNFEEQFIVKEDHTEGKEYFLAPFPNNENDFISLLKAFSIFKKRQQTNMMLVFVSNNNEITDTFDSLLKNYKYREDVILKCLKDSQQNHQLLGAAYAYIDLLPESLIRIAEAMKSGVPVMVSEKARELTGTVALFSEPHDQQQIAEQMMLIYKDENLRRELIKNGQHIVSEYTWERTAELFWNELKT